MNRNTRRYGDMFKTSITYKREKRLKDIAKISSGKDNKSKKQVEIYIKDKMFDIK